MLLIGNALTALDPAWSTPGRSGALGEVAWRLDSVVHWGFEAASGGKLGPRANHGLVLVTGIDVASVEKATMALVKLEGGRMVDEEGDNGSGDVLNDMDAVGEDSPSLDMIEGAALEFVICLLLLTLDRVAAVFSFFRL